MTRFLAAVALCVTAAACSPAPSPTPVQTPPAPAAQQRGDTPLLAPDDDDVRLFERRTEADERDHLSATTLAELRLVRGAATHDAEEFRLAEAASRVALARQPDHPAAIVSLARAVAAQGRADEARSLVRDLLDKQPRHTGALETAFDLAFDAKDERLTAVYAERLLALNEEPGTLRRMAQLAEQRGEFGNARDLLRRAAAEAEDLGAMPWEIADYRRREAAVAAREKESVK